MAFEQSIRGTKRYFEPNFLDKPKFDFVKFIGSYASIVEQFADAFEVQTNKNQQENILSEIFNRYHSIGKENKVLFILIDEFGKFLEYASKHNPEKELYFVQQLAEFCNNPKHNIVLITTALVFGTAGLGCTTKEHLHLERFSAIMEPNSTLSPNQPTSSQFKRMPGSHRSSIHVAQLQ